jgi:hypothetical protein
LRFIAGAFILAALGAGSVALTLSAMPRSLCLRPEVIG